jgi:hypothetical protein
MSPDPSTLFHEFCKYFDGKLRWNAPPSQRTEAIFGFFSELLKREYQSLETNPVREKREYMSIDYLWRYVSGSYEKIELAVEHENEFNLEDFLSSEISHLLDLKADTKVAITYPQGGEEADLIKAVEEKVRGHPTKLSEYFEYYLLILGFATRKGGKPAIRFKGYLLNNKGEMKNTMDETILQASE